MLKYIRSSSYNNWDFCQMQYFLSYVLGIPRKANKKADKGTVVHKVMESLALLKKTYDETGSLEILDDAIGKYSTSIDKFLKPSILSDSAIQRINKQRSNVFTFKTPILLKNNHKRFGVEVVEELFELSYNYYSSKSDEKWSSYDYNDCTNFTWSILDYKDGIFDPRKRKIVDAEPHFDFAIERDWAKIGDDYLKIKGTVDLMTDLGDGTLEVIDWKTGQRKDWGKDVIKDYPYLCQDFQLMLYYYAAKRLYPDAKTIVVTIFFVRDGGPFTMVFDDETLSTVEDKLRERFEEIMNCQIPSKCDPTHQDKKCSQFCEFYKMKAENGNNMCDFIHDRIVNIGMGKTIELYTNKDFSVDNYKAPGGE